MSTLVIDTIQGKTTAGSVNVRGEGSNNTNLQQGLAKAWVNFTGITTTAARDSFNVSGLTDSGTGHTHININSDMANVNYSGFYFTSAAAGANASNFNNQHTGGFGSFTTGSCQVYAYGTTVLDSYQNLVGFHGDLA